MSDSPLFTVVCATLLRPSYAQLAWSVWDQSFRDFEFHARCEPEVNEYVSRNRAAREARGRYLVFCDDDALLQRDHLARLAQAIERNDSPPALGGPLQGNMWGTGTMLLNEPSWGVGANMVFRKDVFDDLGGFEEDWGLGHPTKGWRADTDLWWKVEDRFVGGPTWLPNLIVIHPGPMGATWQPDVEGVFFRRWRKRTIARFVPVDPRLQQFLLDTQDLAPEEEKEVLRARKAMRARIPNLPRLPQEKDP